MSEKPLFTIPEFAATYGVGRSTIYRMLRAGELKAVKIGARTAITREAAEAWRRSLAEYRPAAAGRM